MRYFAIFMVIVAVLWFLFLGAMFPAHAEEVTRMVVTVRGADYELTPGMSVADPIEVDSVGRLAVEDGGKTVYIYPRQSIQQSPPAQSHSTGAKQEVRYKPDGRPYLTTVQSEATETDVYLIEHDLIVQESEQNHSLVAGEQKYQHKSGWFRNFAQAGLSAFGIYSELSEEKAKIEADDKDSQRRYKNYNRRELSDAGRNLGRNVQRNMEEAGDNVTGIVRDIARSRSKRR